MKTQTEKIEYAIQKDDERRFRYIPLEIPDNVETIEIKPSYTGDEANSNVTDQAKNVIDFALLDENGDDLGSSGSNMRKIVISSSFASDGYKRRPPHGTWQIIVGCYQVKDSGATAFYDVTYIFKEFRYLKGDIHTHTTNSDGKYTVLQLAQKAKKKGLDFLFITDHNNSTEDLAIPLVEGLTIIEGLELTNYDGHINLLGVKKPYNGSYATVTLAELNEKLGQAKRNGAMRVLNHPFCFMNPIDYNIDDVDYDGIEIWNGPAVAKEMIAAHWWQKARRWCSYSGCRWFRLSPRLLYYGFAGFPHDKGPVRLQRQANYFDGYKKRPLRNNAQPDFDNDRPAVFGVFGG